MRNSLTTSCSSPLSTHTSSQTKKRDERTVHRPRDGKSCVSRSAKRPHHWVGNRRPNGWHHRCKPVVSPTYTLMGREAPLRAPCGTMAAGRTGQTRPERNYASDDAARNPVPSPPLENRSPSHDAEPPSCRPRRVGRDTRGIEASDHPGRVGPVRYRWETADCGGEERSDPGVRLCPSGRRTVQPPSED